MIKAMLLQAGLDKNRTFTKSNYIIKAMLSQDEIRQIVLWNEANGDLIAMKTRFKSSKKEK